jgi:hypothetical protein
VGSTLFKWVKGWQHSQPLQVGQGWAALTTSSGGSGVGGQHSQPLHVVQGCAALTPSSGGSLLGSTHGSWVSRTHKLFLYVRDRQHSEWSKAGSIHNLFRWVRMRSTHNFLVLRYSSLFFSVIFIIDVQPMPTLAHIVKDLCALFLLK